MPTRYDAAIIDKQADSFYREADQIVRSSTMQFGILGFIVGAIVGGVLGQGSPLLAVILAVVLTVVGVTMGKKIGEARAFRLRFQAQQLLVLVAIEQNTKPERGRAA